MSRPIIIAVLSLGVAVSIPPLASAGTARHGVSADQRPPYSVAARRGLAFAEQRCSACHAVTSNASSPNPEAPPFEDVANRPEVTPASLRQFLRDSHNYPAAMNFAVGAAEVSDLADYMATLRKPGYQPIG
jgi:mono/diheme cytochrome c family protein